MTLPLHPLTNFEIQEYYQNEPRFNGVFSRDNLGSAVKNGAYVINLDEYHDIGTHWVALYVTNKTIMYFDSFGVEHIPREIMKTISISNLEVCKANEISELKDLTKYRLDEINRIKEYFNAEIKERKCIIRKISKYIVAFNYADKVFITLSASFGTLSIASYAMVVGIPAGITGASLILIFIVTTGVVKTLLNITRKKKKKHNKIIALARSKLNIIENLISQALINFEITHEEFSKIIYEKNNYEQIIDNIKSVKSINDLNK